MRKKNRNDFSSSQVLCTMVIFEKKCSIVKNRYVSCLLILIKQNFWKMKIKASTVCGIKSIISIWHAYSSSVVNWSSHQSNLAYPRSSENGFQSFLAYPMTSKFSWNIVKHTYKKLPKFDGCGTSLWDSTPIVPIHFTQPVCLRFSVRFFMIPILFQVLDMMWEDSEMMLTYGNGHT